MSLLLLIDGYNIVAPIAPSRNPNPRWLEENRNVLLRDLTDHLDEPIRERTCVVFDAANPPKNRPNEYVHRGILVRFAVGYLSADELLHEIIGGHHTPKRLMVVSSDHRVQMSASRRGAKFFDSQPWIDDLTDGIVHLAVDRTKRRTKQGTGRAGQGSDRKVPPGPVKPEGIASESESAVGDSDQKKPRIQDETEVSDWLREFGFDAD